MSENIISISATGIFYVLDGTVALAASLRVWQHFREKRNAMARNFAVLFLSVSANFLLNGFSLLLVPENLFLIKVCFLVGLGILFLGFAFGIRSFLDLMFPKLAQNAGSILTLIFGATIIILNIINFELPQVGLETVNWKLERTSFYIFCFLILMVTIPLSIEFGRYSLRSLEFAKKGILFAFTFFLVGGASLMTLSDSADQVLIFSQSIMAFGFVLGAVVFVLYNAFKNQNQ